jgi:signal transduction histidine kinase
LHPLDFFDTDEDKAIIAQAIADTFNYGEANVQADLVPKTKEKIPYYFTGTTIEYEGNTCVAGLGIDFSERTKAQQKIKETTEQLRQLTTHLQTVREEERKRIGREIHDELGQQLTAIKMDIAWIDKKIPEETVLIKSKLKNVIGLLDGSNKSIRRILSELRPGILDDRGLLEAIKWLGRQLTANTGIQVQFTSNETDLKSPEPIATCIFRVYQEALTNIMRYADATNVQASLNIVSDNIRVNIQDDGRGFDPASVQSNKSFGILGMKERVLSLGGTFELISSPGNGTKISICLPVYFSRII